MRASRRSSGLRAGRWRYDGDLAAGNEHEAEREAKPPLLSLRTDWSQDERHGAVTDLRDCHERAELLAGVVVARL